MNDNKLFFFRALLLSLVLALPILASAQKLTVESLEQVPDATAMMEEYAMKDNNGDFAGIVKVLIAVDGVEFDGGGVLKQQRMARGEYWVWMAKDSSRLTVRAPGFLPLEVNFRKYEGVNIVHSKTTYKLVLTVPNTGGQQDDGKGFLAFKVEPTSATLTIDGQEVALLDGEYSKLVDKGTYSYAVSAKGYASQSGTVRVDDNTQMKTIRLESTFSTLQVSCATPGVQIYLDGQLKGTVPQTLTLSTETHRIEARLEGYRSYKEDITLGERENRRLDIPALMRLTGSLRVNYKPLGSEVYVDGAKVGTNPATFRNVAVGSHTVEIRKDGYVSERKSVTLRENAITDLSGSLTASTAPVQNDNANPTNNAVSSLSSGGNIKTFTANGVSFNMVRVAGGTFKMGAMDGDSDASDIEKPVHDVTLGDYMIGETEVTQELWEAVMGTNPSEFKGAKNPVEEVSWEDCNEFIDKLNIATGQQFRLPTEAEWEYAARGGQKSQHYKYSGSKSLKGVAWYESNSKNTTHPVGTKAPNELGIYDMSGNVWEWCADWYYSYSSSAQTNPKGPDKGSDRVCRGGSWLNVARGCRVSYRSSSAPVNRGDALGFRLAL